MTKLQMVELSNYKLKKHSG